MAMGMASTPATITRHAKASSQRVFGPDWDLNLQKMTPRINPNSEAIKSSDQCYISVPWYIYNDYDDCGLWSWLWIQLQPQSQNTPRHHKQGFLVQIEISNPGRWHGGSVPTFEATELPDQCYRSLSWYIGNVWWSWLMTMGMVPPPITITKQAKPPTPRGFGQYWNPDPRQMTRRLSANIWSHRITWSQDVCMFLVLQWRDSFPIYKSIKTTGQGILDARTVRRLSEHRTLYTTSISTRRAGGLDSKWPKGSS